MLQLQAVIFGKQLIEEQHLNQYLISMELTQLDVLAIDPDNPNVVWAGTGENNHQRALGYGDGVYKSIRWRKKLEKYGT